MTDGKSLPIEAASPPLHSSRQTAKKLALMTAVALGVFVSSAAVLAQTPEAQQAMAAGEADAAIAAWSKVLANEPDNVEALIGRATVYGWRSNWPQAETDVQRALQLEPNNIAALNAAGYLKAWSGNHAAAEPYFRRMLELAPDNSGAKRGLGYNALWAGRNEEAATTFEALATEASGDPEPLVAAGNARLAAGQAGRSARNYNLALARNPSNAEARRGLNAAHDYPAMLELSVWGGDTSGGGDAGLRLVELASWVTPRTRISAKYDDGLSLDNPVLARSGQNATSYFVGAQHQFGEHVIGVAELGYRDLPQGENQEIYKVEGIYLSKAGATKLGGQLSPHSAGFTDRLIYAGHNFRLGESFSFEPTVYIARTGAARDDEWRAVGYGEYKIRNFAIGLGIGGGQVLSLNPAADGGVFTIFGNASVRVAGWHRAHLNVTREEAPLGDFTRVLVGITLRLPRN